MIRMHELHAFVSPRQIQYARNLLQIHQESQMRVGLVQKNKHDHIKAAWFPRLQSAYMDHGTN